MKRVVLIFTVLTILFSAKFYSQEQSQIPWPTLAKSDWPMIKHDPQFTGRSPYKGPQTPTIVWSVDIPDGIFSGPVIGQDGHLYFGSYYQLDSADHFYSYTSNGHLLWDYQLGNNRPPQSGIVIDSSNTIYFGSLDQYFYALNPDGTLKWKVKTSYITEIVIPNIDLQGNLYVTNNPEGELLSISPKGEINWRVKYEDGFLQKSPAISPDGKTIYIAGKDSNLFAINLDGTLKWEFKCGKIERAPIIDNQGNLYFVPIEVPQYLYSISPSAEVNWKTMIQNIGEYVPYSIPTIDAEGNIYVMAIDTLDIPFPALLSYDSNGKLRWIYNFDDHGNDDFWQPLICDSEGTIYVGSTFGKYYYAISSDGKLKWKLPLNDYQVDNTGAITKDGTLILGLHRSSLWNGNERNLIAIKDTTTYVAEETVVKDYALSLNYPNPFNPTTKFTYRIPKEELVTIKVFDALGREVKTLVNEVKSAGRYEVEFNAENLSSGVYLVVMEAGNFVQTRKVTLLK